ncbi:uroporphyrinogen decarboxylase [Robiginitomaculum antarcticum]|uniref:uroporphyrinogen decarboxylase n=1 Tax=Robiginitomaculum antarcticum TaxID=437507 RepID=UPI0003A2B6FD|nr:uroporphyrinogen decarboxylase [Robiginitomaculum antarcticum]
MTPLILRALQGETLPTPPIWFMRQAGRHLPEYLATRAKSKDFIDFCFSPDLASEATLQPVRRYDVDGAILFADILLIPIGLGRSVHFEKGVGPVLEPITVEGISKLTIDGAADRISSIYETVSKVRAALPEDKTLIGFAGGCWTVATYMIEGRGTPDKEKAKRFAYENPDAMDDLLDALAVSTAEYLVGQARAGTQVLKIFESWAQGLSPAQFETLVISPTRKIIHLVREAGITVPIIGFPRAAGLNMITFSNALDLQGLAVGTDTSMGALRPHVRDGLCLQGNLDPLLLRMGGQAMLDGVDRVLDDAAQGPHIFNLGHGVTPDVKIESVHGVINRIRER